MTLSDPEHCSQREMCLQVFEHWSQGQQTEFVEMLINRMSFHQHEHIYSILMPILQRDFITALPGVYLHVYMCSVLKLTA